MHRWNIIWFPALLLLFAGNALSEEAFATETNQTLRCFLVGGDRITGTVDTSGDLFQPADCWFTKKRLAYIDGARLPFESISLRLDSIDKQVRIHREDLLLLQCMDKTRSHELFCDQLLQFERELLIEFDARDQISLRGRPVADPESLMYEINQLNLVDGMDTVIRLAAHRRTSEALRQDVMDRLHEAGYDRLGLDSHPPVGLRRRCIPHAEEERLLNLIGTGFRIGYVVEIGEKTAVNGTPCPEGQIPQYVKRLGATGSSRVQLLPAGDYTIDQFKSVMSALSRNGFRSVYAVGVKGLPSTKPPGTLRQQGIR